jgi:hypothetical protein
MNHCPFFLCEQPDSYNHLHAHGEMFDGVQQSLCMEESLIRPSFRASFLSQLALRFPF